MNLIPDYSDYLTYTLLVQKASRPGLRKSLILVNRNSQLELVSNVQVLDRVLCEFGSPTLRVSLAHPVHPFTVTASVVIVQERAERGDLDVPEAPANKVEATAVQADPTINPADKEASASGGLVDLIIQIGPERQPIVESLRDALLNGDDTEALERTRELTFRHSP